MNPRPDANAESAIADLRHALDTRPDDAELHCALAERLQNAGRGDEAAEHYQRAIARDPGLRRAWYNLGCLCNSQDREADAVPCFRRSIELDPAHAPSWHNLGQALFNLGDTDGAIEPYRQAIALGGGGLSETMLAMTIAVSPSADPQAILQTRRRWAEQHLPGPMWDSGMLNKGTGTSRYREIADENCWSLGASPLFQHADRGERAADKGPEQQRRLRVGYVSAFFDHPNWMKPVWALVNRHDRERFELFLYSDGRPRQAPAGHSPAEYCPAGYCPDARDTLRSTGALSHVEMARLIRADELDLLRNPDLNAGSGSRLPRLAAFALRPAPVQVGWFNMFATTGMAAFDYLIGDETVVLPGEESDYSERIARVAGCYLTFEVTYPVPDVAPPPCQADGRFTFGSLASLYKITPHVVALWGRILRQSPGSRLLLRNSGFRTAANRDWFRERFSERGIEPARLHFEGPTDHFDFLRTYDQIDLALDTFPYNGGTTTSEALWQGVPVVAIHGDRWTSRVSSSLLINAGLSEFIAPDADGYVGLAVAMANDPTARDRLARLRPAMRDRLRRSLVCDADGYTRGMEDVYEAIIQEERNRMK